MEFLQNKITCPQRMIDFSCPDTYWKCNVIGHRHQTYSVAQRCIERLKNVKRKEVQDHRARNFRITKKVIGGGTFRDVGAEEGISGTRCKQIYDKLMRQCFKLSPSVSFGPPCSYRNIEEIRTNWPYWLMLLNELSQKQGLSVKKVIKKGDYHRHEIVVHR